MLKPNAKHRAAAGTAARMAKAIPDKVKLRVVIRQDGKCATCGERLFSRQNSMNGARRRSPKLWRFPTIRRVAQARQNKSSNDNG
jgi:hypothetical protein